MHLSFFAVTLPFLFAVSLPLLLSLPLAAASPATAQPARIGPMDTALVERAVRRPSPRWRFVDPARYREMPETFALQITALAAHATPDHVIDGHPLAAHLAAKLRFFLVTPKPDPDGSTREPEAQGGIGGWTHHVPALSLLLAKTTPAVWSRLTPDEHARADLLMQALAVAAHWSLDDDNDYYLLLDGWSLYHKSWNPNHVQGYVGVIVAASLYFGSEDLNTFFRTFDFDHFLARLEAANFRNIARCWTWNPAIRDLLMHGGEIAVPADQVLDQGFVSRGAGVRNDFTHRGIPLSAPWALHRSHAMHLYHKIVRSTIHAHAPIGLSGTILGQATGATRSPFEGQTGLIFELESNDWSGLRTSLIYAYEAALCDLPTAATLQVLGHWDDAGGGDTLTRRMAVGMGDLLFRATEGYAGWANGRAHTTTYADLEPLGADYVIELWRAYFTPPPPPPSPPIRH